MKLEVVFSVPGQFIFAFPLLLQSLLGGGPDFLQQESFPYGETDFFEGIPRWLEGSALFFIALLLQLALFFLFLVHCLFLPPLFRCPSSLLHLTSAP